MDLKFKKVCSLKNIKAIDHTANEVIVLCDGALRVLDESGNSRAITTTTNNNIISNNNNNNNIISNNISNITHFIAHNDRILVISKHTLTCGTHSMPLAAYDKLLFNGLVGVLSGGVLTVYDVGGSGASGVNANTSASGVNASVVNANTSASNVNTSGVNASINTSANTGALNTSASNANTNTGALNANTSTNASEGFRVLKVFENVRNAGFMEEGVVIEFMEGRVVEYECMRDNTLGRNDTTSNNNTHGMNDMNKVSDTHGINDMNKVSDTHEVSNAYEVSDTATSPRPPVNFHALKETAGRLLFSTARSYGVKNKTVKVYRKGEEVADMDLSGESVLAGEEDRLMIIYDEDFRYFYDDVNDDVNDNGRVGSDDVNDSGRVGSDDVNDNGRVGNRSSDNGRVGSDDAARSDDRPRHFKELVELEETHLLFLGVDEAGEVVGLKDILVFKGIVYLLGMDGAVRGYERVDVTRGKTSGGVTSGDVMGRGKTSGDDTGRGVTSSHGKTSVASNASNNPSSHGKTSGREEAQRLSEKFKTSSLFSLNTEMFKSDGKGERGEKVDGRVDGRVDARINESIFLSARGASLFDEDADENEKNEKGAVPGRTADRQSNDLSSFMDGLGKAVSSFTLKDAGIRTTDRQSNRLPATQSHTATPSHTTTQSQMTTPSNRLSATQSKTANRLSATQSKTAMPSHTTTQSKTATPSHTTTQSVLKKSLQAELSSILADFNSLTPQAFHLPVLHDDVNDGDDSYALHDIPHDIPHDVNHDGSDGSYARIYDKIKKVHGFDRRRVEMEIGRMTAVLEQEMSIKGYVEYFDRRIGIGRVGIGRAGRDVRRSSGLDGLSDRRAPVYAEGMSNFGIESGFVEEMRELSIRGRDGMRGRDGGRGVESIRGMNGHASNKANESGNLQFGQGFLNNLEMGGNGKEPRGNALRGFQPTERSTVNTSSNAPVNAPVNAPINAPVNAFTNTSNNAFANTPVNAFTNTSSNAPINTSVNAPNNASINSQSLNQSSSLLSHSNPSSLFQQPSVFGSPAAKPAMQGTSTLSKFFNKKDDVLRKMEERK